MTAAFDDTYLLELRGLGVVWRTRPEHSPAAATFGTPAPEVRDGMIGVGSSIRSRIGLLDPRARPGGLTVQITADSAIDLFREGGDPVRGPGGRAVYAVVPLDEYSLSTDGHLWVQEDGPFSGAPLTVGERYIVGTEVVQIDALDTTDPAVGTRYEVTRGVAGSAPVPRPVWWTEGDRQYAAPGGDNQVRTVVDTIYPEGRPPTLTGWPVRLWRADASGVEVVYDGIVSRVRSSGAVAVVEIASRSASELARPWREPWGYMVGQQPGAPSSVVPVTLRLPIDDDDALAVVVGLYENATGRGAIEGPDGGPVVAIPASSLPAAEASVDVWSAVRVRVGDRWAAVPIRAWLDDAPVADARFRYAELERWPGGTGAGPIAYGEGDGPLRSVAVSDEGSRHRAIGETYDAEHGLYRASTLSGVVEGYRVRISGDEEWFSRPAPCYLVPAEKSVRWAPDILGPVEGRMGDRFRLLDDHCIRAPYWGASVADVVDAQLGAQGLAYSVSPSGTAVAIDWIQPPPGSAAAVAASALTQPSTMEIGEPGRVSRLTLAWDGASIDIPIVGRTLSPRGVEIERELGPILTDAEGASIDAVVYWSQVLGVYRGTIPRARIEVRDDGSGAVQALAPGVLVGLIDPALPSGDGTRGFDGAALALEVEIRLESRTAAIDALLIDYGRAAPRPWGPTVRVTSGGTGTTVSLSTQSIALGAGVRVFRSLAGVDVLVIERDGTVVGTGTLMSMDADGECDVAFAASTTVPVGALMMVADAPAQALYPFASGYYGITEWR